MFWYANVRRVDLERCVLGSWGDERTAIDDVMPAAIEINVSVETIDRALCGRAAGSV